MKLRGFGSALRGLLSKSDITAEDWQEIEDQLLLADVGVTATTEIVKSLKKSAESKEDLLQKLREVLISVLNVEADRKLNLSAVPAVIVIVGVNGVGKTTSIGKLGSLLKASGKSVLFAAADTFRAAAVDQLKTWGDRSEITVIAKSEGSDPASVAHEAAMYAVDHGIEVVLLDTAGRLHNKKALMDELGKVVKVADRVAPVTEVLLVLDATIGQNGLMQAKVFAEVVPLSGVVLTKFDGTAKGGIVISVQRELGIPVKYIGVGEGISDLIAFDPDWFVSQLLETNT
ncbi:MAG: hypothetical protein RIT32_994 [Actinomycetota bacterium]|jgi:fused signal recognition particle receptor